MNDRNRCTATAAIQSGKDFAGSCRATQIAEAQGIADIVCVQNQYKLAHRGDDPLVEALARQGIACVPFFPLGGFTPLGTRQHRPAHGKPLSTLAVPAAVGG